MPIPCLRVFYDLTLPGLLVRGFSWRRAEALARKAARRALHDYGLAARPRVFERTALNILFRNFDRVAASAQFLKIRKSPA